MNIHGELEEKDCLRLLSTLRFVRKYISREDIAHQIVIEPEIEGVKVQITLAVFVDMVLNEYRDHSG